MKLDISSTAIEKTVDAAKGFLNKLITPSIEETGLLIKEKVTMWRFQNQIRTVNKAREYCIKHNISPKEISLKLLCPLLDYSGLEEETTMQDKWGILLANMVDSEQNIQSHVFPYLLSQISKNEFEVLEKINNQRLERITPLKIRLEEQIKNNLAREKQIVAVLESLNNKKANPIEVLQLNAELKNLKLEEDRLLREIEQHQTVPDHLLRDFEFANLTRLGILQMITLHSAHTQPIRIPQDSVDDIQVRTIDLEIEIEPDDYFHILTELGILFISACSEKETISR